MTITGATQALASLPMYDVAPVQSATDRFWLLIRQALHEADVMLDVDGIAIPEQLVRSPAIPAHWLHPALLLSQTCGYPYTLYLREQVTLVGTPDYGIVENLPGWYVSEIVVRADDPRVEFEQFEGACFAYNSLDSQSGLHAMMHTLSCKFGDQVFFGNCLKTFEHVASAKAVALGQADIAAIDAVTWRLLRQHDSCASELRVLMSTAPSPGLPYITSINNEGAVVAAAVAVAIDRLCVSDRAALGLCGLWRSTPEDYDIIAERARRARGVCKVHGLIAS